MTSLGYFFSLALMVTGLALYVILLFGVLLWLVGVIARVTEKRPSLLLHLTLVVGWMFIMALFILIPFAFFA